MTESKGITQKVQMQMLWFLCLSLYLSKCFLYVCSVCACLDLSVSTSSWGLGRAAVCDCGTPWTFLLLFWRSTGCLMLIGIYKKFCEDSLNGFQVIERTQFCDRVQWK